MSLSTAGVWAVDVWDQTVWADGVWREGEYTPLVAPLSRTIFMMPKDTSIQQQPRDTKVIS